MLEIFRFECRVQGRSPLFLLVAGAFFLLACAATARENVQVGGGGANLDLDAAFTVVQTTYVFSIHAMFAYLAVRLRAGHAARPWAPCTRCGTAGGIRWRLAARVAELRCLARLASVPLAATHGPARRTPPYGSTPDHGPNGFRVRTRKLYADVEGRDTETALDQYLDVGAPCP